ncbi:MAG: sulfurtransferase TusA family protein [Methanothrix sp.]|nr:sulfurtransferase TusA family protein [Methanothrix sp.]
MTDLISKTPAEILDVLGRACPYPIVLIKKEMEKLPSGAVLKVLCDSQSTAEEVIPRYCEKHGYLFESVKAEDEGQWELYIQKT